MTELKEASLAAQVPLTQMTKFWSGWPIPRWVFPATGSAAIANGVVSTRSAIAEPYQVWIETSSSWHETLWPLGAILAAVAAFMAGSLFRRDSLLALPLRSRLGSSVVGRQVGWLSAWAVVGHCLGLLPLTISTARSATWGHLGGSNVLIALLGVVFFCAFGYVLGLLIKSWVAAPVSAAAALLIMQVPNTPIGRPLALLQPVQQWTISPRFVQTLGTTVFTVNAIIALIIVSAVVSSFLLNRHSVNKSFVLAWGVIPVLLLVVAFAWRPEFYRVADEVPAVCWSEQETPVCIHQAYSKSRGDVTAVVDALQGAGAVPLLKRVTEVSVADYGQPPGGEVSFAVDLRSGVDDQLTQSARESLAWQIADQLISAPCLKPGVPLERYDAQVMVRNALLTNAGFGAVVDHSGGQMPPENISSGLAPFIRANAGKIDSCSLTSQDLGA